MPAAGSMPITNTTVARFSVASPGVADQPIQLDDTEWRMVGQFRNDGTTNQFAVTSVTGTTTQTDILAQCISLLDQDFNGRAGRFRIRLVATKTGTAGTFTIGCSGTVSGIVTLDHQQRRGQCRQLHLRHHRHRADPGGHGGQHQPRPIAPASTPLPAPTAWQSDIASKQLNRAQDIKLHVTLGNAADSVAPTLVQVFQAGSDHALPDRLPLAAGRHRPRPALPTADNPTRSDNPQAWVCSRGAERRLVGHAIARRRDEERRLVRYWCVEAATGRLVTVSRVSLPADWGNVGGRLHGDEHHGSRSRTCRPRPSRMTVLPLTDPSLAAIVADMEAGAGL